MPEKFQVVPLRAFKDNYVWTLRNGACAAVVDPGEAQPVLDYLAAEKLQLIAILATHHHQDHVGGIAELLQTHKVPVYGPRGEPIATLTQAVGGGDKVSLEQLGVSFEVLDIPGHTRAHVAYYGANMLFCGDTLFACGCGRAFEGTPQQLYASLEKLMALPGRNARLLRARVHAGEHRLRQGGGAGQRGAARARGERRAVCGATTDPTLPSTIGREKATNPFRARHAARGHRLGQQISRQARVSDPAGGVRRAAAVEERYPESPASSPSRCGLAR